MPSISEIGEQTADEANSSEPASSGSGGGQTDAEFTPYDVSEASFVKQHPTTQIGGTPVALRYFSGDPDDDENDPDRGDFGVVLEDAFVATDGELDGLDLSNTVVLDGDGESDDYKVVNDEDSAVSWMTTGGAVDYLSEDAVPEDADDDVDVLGEGDDIIAVDFDGNTYNGDVVDAFEGEIVLKLTGNAGWRAARTLDVNGAPGAGAERQNGSIVIEESGLVSQTHGLIEHHPDNDDENYTPPRVARAPQLRPDVEGDTVSVALRRTANVIDDYEGRSYWATVTVGEGDDLDVLEPTDEFADELDDDLLEVTEWIEWRFPSSEEIEQAQEQAIEA